MARILINIMRTASLLLLTLPLFLITGVNTAGAATCGDGACEKGEDTENCPDDCFESYMWLSYLLTEHVQKREMTENIFRAASERGQAFILAVDETADIGQLEDILQLANDIGVEIWLEINNPVYPSGITAWGYVYRPENREQSLDRIRGIIRAYISNSPICRVHLFDEAPQNHAFWSWKGANDTEKRQYIDDVFVYIRDAIKEEAASGGRSCDVGLFLQHEDWEFLYRGNVVMDPLTESGDVPDFIFISFYNTATPFMNEDEARTRTEATIRNATERTGRPVYFLGQQHTAKPYNTSTSGPTPSKDRINKIISWVLEFGASGAGFYHQNQIATDTVNYPDAFIPNNINSMGLSAGGRVYESSRDRWDYSSLRLFEVANKDPGGLFDLWIYGFDFDGNEFELQIKNSSGGWERIGYLNSNLVGSLYDYNDRDHVIMFRGLPRDKYIVNSRIEAKLIDRVPDYLAQGYQQYDFSSESPKATLHGLYVMPHRRTNAFLTEEEATEQIKIADNRAILCAEDLDAPIGRGEEYVRVISAADCPQFFSQWASSATATSEYPDSRWTAADATGSAGDFRVRDPWILQWTAHSAWCKGSLKGSDSIRLEYDTSVTPSSLSIYFMGPDPDNYDISGVSLRRPDGSWDVVWEGKNDKSILTIDLTDVDYSTSTVRVTTEPGSWGCIDAAELILQKCSDLGGSICLGDEVCPSSWIKASGTDRCCPLPCQERHRADTREPLGVIDMVELIAFIDLWYTDSTTYSISEMNEALRIWKQSS